MDGRRIRKEKVAFLNENGYVCTGPKLNGTLFSTFSLSHSNEIGHRQPLMNVLKGKGTDWVGKQK